MSDVPNNDLPLSAHPYTGSRRHTPIPEMSALPTPYNVEHMFERQGSIPVTVKLPEARFRSAFTYSVKLVYVFRSEQFTAIVRLHVQAGIGINVIERHESETKNGCSIYMLLWSIRLKKILLLGKVVQEPHRMKNTLEADHPSSCARAEFWLPYLACEALRWHSGCRDLIGHIWNDSGVGANSLMHVDRKGVHRCTGAFGQPLSSNANHQSDATKYS
jgi:hypothetical protein